MGIYIVLMVFWFIFYIFCREANYSKRIITLGFWGALVLVMGLRGSTVGSDTWNYLFNIYDNAEYYLLYRDAGEEGFFLYNYILDSIGVGKQGYLFIYAILVSAAFSHFFYKYSQNVYVSFFLHLTIGLFAVSMSAMRQTLAVCLTLFAFDCIVQRKFLRFVIIVLIATSFHSSALCFLPIYFLNRLQIDSVRNWKEQIKIKNLKIKLVVFVTGTLLPIFVSDSFTELISAFVPERYSYAIDHALQHQLNPLLVVVNFLVPISCLFVLNKNNLMKQKTQHIYLILMILSGINIIVNILAMNINLFNRFSFYFLVYNMLLIPNSIATIDNKWLKMLAYAACLLLPTIQFFMTTPGGVLEIDNYRFFWE